MSTAYETVIGLEVHVQLNTKSKIFCGCSTRFSTNENVNTCPVCTGMPGSLPVLNKRAVEYGIRLALATGCKIQPRSVFARKNYYYPDLPKGYQISQYDQPLATEGGIEITTSQGTKRIRLERIHMEEDAGKNIHRGHESYVNLNRAGVPLLEVVSYPDIRTAQEASRYVKDLRGIVRYLGISDGNMEEGNLRCDVNISLRKEGTEKLGTRAEIKNVNSFKFVEKAIAYEIERQKEVLESGKAVVLETRLWDSQAGKTFSMRSKEEAHDYRYFTEPDLLPLIIDTPWIESVKKSLPELPKDKKARFIKDFKLSDYDASLLSQEKSLADYFEAAVAIGKDPKKVGNWILSELLREFNMDKIESCPVTAEHLGNLVKIIGEGTISGKIAKDVFQTMIKTGKAPQKIVEEEGLVQISDSGALEPMIDEVLQKNQDAVKRYRGGQVKLLGFFVGQIMKVTKGKANPGLINKILKQKLDKK